MPFLKVCWAMVGYLALLSLARAFLVSLSLYSLSMLVTLPPLTTS